MKDSNPHVHKTVVFKTTAITNSANLPNFVVAVGFEPTNLKGNVLQTACFNHLHTLPYSNFKLIYFAQTKGVEPLSMGLETTILPIKLHLQKEVILR